MTEPLVDFHKKGFTGLGGIQTLMLLAAGTKNQKLPAIDPTHVYPPAIYRKS